MNPIAYIPRVISALFALTVVSAHSQPVAKPLVPRGAYAAEDLARLTPGTECGALASAFTTDSTRSTPASGRIAA